ncbi:bifunctional diaminohydroxyphosphoribosylaminopyrimidine deaminase/5-amino-6-(5-phosphoribosylamino)uracil reductase RibD [Undibacterium sp. TJN25]|uniref:bifunctional diaminohydroxyphosphoribosylaminopyrimidine deaminase/5-amino-6-(5-phosphoribosylamino)uracil reductase RibD n=1 Tax=Undibacterium sp. TJN25 TaxID=3413056 RepID=UPI003BF42863
MSKTLDLVKNTTHRVAPNPKVGCLILKNEKIIGSGVTQPPGGNHAEIEAMNDALSHGHDLTGSTAFVTLEPCSHFGRTPPCSDALIKAGIKTVVVGCLDPNPLVQGQGIAKLKAAGIEVITGVLEQEARESNLGFLTRMEKGRPWTRMKTAASLDGKTALHNGKSQWITGAAARHDGHLWRARAGAILTGIGTVLDDDPQLNVRGVEVATQPLRVIVDSKLQISLHAKILAGGGSLVVCAVEDSLKIQALRQAGTEVICLPNAKGKVDLPALMQELGRRQINELHIEAGSKLNGSLIREHCVDELLLYVAPKLLGDARGLFDLDILESLDGATNLSFHEVTQIGEDLRILARFNPPQ